MVNPDGPQAKRPLVAFHGESLRPAITRLVAALGDRLAQAEPYAGERDRPTDVGLRDGVFADQERAVFYDADAIREVGAEPREFLSGTRGDGSQCDVLGRSGRQALGPTGFGTTGSRNARNVWTVSTKPFSGSHFATMPPDLAERCIRAGCPIGGRIADPFGGAE